MSAFFARPSTRLYFACFALLVLIKLLFDYYPGDFPARGQAAAFTWPIVLGISLLAFLGFFADRASGLPEPFADPTLERRGILIAVASGTIYAAVMIARFIFLRDPSAVDPLSGGGWPHMLLPWSVPFYAFGAILLEFMLRLGALYILFWFFYVVVARKHGRQLIFWILATTISLYEIAPYLAEDIGRHNWHGAGGEFIEPLYLFNVFECWLLLRYGWFAPIVFRLSQYFVWHVLFGGV